MRLRALGPTIVAADAHLQVINIERDEIAIGQLVDVFRDGQVLHAIRPRAETQEAVANDENAIATGIGQAGPARAPVIVAFLRPPVVEKIVLHRSRVTSDGGAAMAVPIRFLRTKPKPLQIIAGRCDLDLHADARQIGQAGRRVEIVDHRNFAAAMHRVFNGSGRLRAWQIEREDDFHAAPGDARHRD